MVTDGAGPRAAGGGRGPAPELRHLRYFAAVAEAGAFSDAARRLGVAQQVLSRQVADLERALGVALLARHARGVRLTPAGAEFLAAAREALAAVERAVDGARQRAAAAAGRVRVAAPELGSGLGLFAAAVAALGGPLGGAGGAPVRVEACDVPWVDQPRALRDGRVDVGFLHGAVPPAELATWGPDLCAELLLDDPLTGALLPAGHPLAARAVLALADLDAEPMLVAPRAVDAALHDRVVGALRAAGLRAARVLDPFPTPAAKLGMVAAGLGWAPVPRSAAHWAPFGTVFRPLAGVAVPFRLDLVWRRGEEAPPVLRFLEVARRVRRSVGPPPDARSAPR